MLLVVLVIALCCGEVFTKNVSVPGAEESLIAPRQINNALPMFSRESSLLLETIESIKNKNCKKDANLIIKEMVNLTNWAVKFYDSSGKLPEGILSGSTYHFGNFDECIGIGDDDDAPESIKGKYCLGNVRIQVPDNYLNKKNSIWPNFRNRSSRYDESISEIHWGICVPASCKSEDIQDFIKKIIDLTFNNSMVKLTPTIAERQCYTNEQIPYDNIDLIYLTIIMTIILMIAIGTIFDVVCVKKNEEKFKGIVPQIMTAFSLVTNLKKLCGPANNDGLDLDCISGIKLLAMAFIVAGHCLVFIVGGPILNRDFWTNAVSKIENSIFLNNPLLVDTFLLLSGFLFARILLRELDKRRSVNFLYLYIFRYIRLTPAYLVIVGLYVTWLPRLDTGPLWYRMIQEKQRCQASWWTNILYINNYVNTDQLCMFQSWYLSVDTQLFILAPAIIYPLWRWRKLGEFILASSTVVAIVVPFTVTLVSKLDPTLMAYTEEIKDISVNEYFKETYIKTHMRASAYCFGLIYGYVLYRIQAADYKLTKKHVRVGWVVCILSLVTSMFSIGIFYGPRKDFTSIEAAVYSSLHRALWSFGTGWVLLACITNNSGPLKKFLRWRPFVPLSRLTYSAYLVNGLVELHSISTTRTPNHLDNYSLFAKVMSHLMITFLGAVVISTFFEAPILGLERIFLRPAMNKENDSNRPGSEETSTTDA